MNKHQSQKKQQVAQKQVDWPRMLRAAGPYPVEAFTFVREGLSHTAHQAHPDPEAVPESERHMSGQQLCMGLRDYALQQYGLLAPVVLRHWHIRRTDDFGRIVYAMVQEGLMTKTADDSIEDFRSVYDFEEAFNADQLLMRVAAG